MTLQGFFTPGPGDDGSPVTGHYFETAAADPVRPQVWGYTDALSYAPGDTLRVHAMSHAPRIETFAIERANASPDRPGDQFADGVDEQKAEHDFPAARGSAQRRERPMQGFCRRIRVRAGDTRHRRCAIPDCDWRRESTTTPWARLRPRRVAGPCRAGCTCRVARAS